MKKREWVHTLRRPERLAWVRTPARRQKQKKYVWQDVAGFMKENIIICLNSLPFLKGLVTRTRKYSEEVKESTVDIYVVCHRIFPHISSMELIDCTEHSLTNYSTINKGEAAITSDHAPWKMEIKVEANLARKDNKYLF